MGDGSTHNLGEADSHFAPPTPPSNTDYRHARRPHTVSLRPLLRPQPASERAAEPNTSVDSRHVTVVGVCSAGKSTLVRALRERGYKARTVAQEHSHVPYLWQRSRPDVVIYLDASLPTIRRRRRVRWSQPVLDEERRRLSHAREHAHLYIHTDGLSPQDVASRALTYLNNSR